MCVCLCSVVNKYYRVTRKTQTFYRRNQNMTDERGRERVRLREIHRGGGERKRGKNGTVKQNLKEVMTEIYGRLLAMLRM